MIIFYTRFEGPERNLSIGVWNCYAATCCDDRKLFCYKKRKEAVKVTLSMIREMSKRKSCSSQIR